MTDDKDKRIAELEKENISLKLEMEAVRRGNLMLNEANEEVGKENLRLKAEVANSSARLTVSKGV